MSCNNCDGSSTNLHVTRGESATFLLTVVNLTTKQPIDITGALAWFTVKNRVEDPGATISKKNTAAGGVDGQILISSPQSGATLGQLQVFLTPPDTAGLDPDDEYWCDAWVQLSSGKRYQVVSNRSFTIDPAVTTSF